MNTRIKMAIAAIACNLVLAGGYCAQAQETFKPTPIGAPRAAGKHRGGRRLARIAQELGLTAAQKAEAKSVLKGAHEQRRSIRASTVSAAEKKTELKALHQSSRAQIAALLTPDQKAKWQKMRRHHRPAKAN